MQKNNSKIKLILLAIIIFGIFGWVKNTLAVPAISSVSGTATDGSMVTIYGSGFGLKAMALPYRWDNFEHGIPGQLVTGWSDGVGSDIALFSNELQRGSIGHFISSKHQFRPSQENVSLCANDYTNGYPILYIDYWYNLNPIDSNGINGRNYKPWRVWTNDITLQMNPGIFPSVNQYGGGIFSIYDNGDLEQPMGTSLWNGEGRNYGEWKHEQVIYRTSTPGVADGYMHRYVNSQPSTAFSDTLVFRNRNILPTEIRIGHYWATDADPGDPIVLPANTGADAYIDDLYIDRTWSRVEIGNAPNYNSCTHREIQVPDNWSNNSIEIKINQGSFDKEDSVFLYVADSNNSINITGYPVSFDLGLTDTTPPTVPSGLTVN